jgi:glycosyltransferase involved in cell wall biosynthesis
MIVKDESKVICRCLESVKPFIDYWVIVDTGSSDGTQKIIKEYMKDVPGELHERPWVNFGHNRNEALDFARSKADYILFIDADDTLEFVKNYARPSFEKDAYTVKIDHGGSNYYRTVLIKASLPWRWVGVLHEVVVCDVARSIGNLDGVTYMFLGDGDRSQNPKKYEKDALVLEKALKDEPNNARYVFYLAQSYKDAKMFEKSMQAYERRVAMGGWDEEIFWSLYQIAEINEWLNMPEETILKGYLRAYQYRPSRAEPLCRLSTYYRNKENYLMGYLFSQFAAKIPQSNDTLFVEYWVYEYGCLLEFSICAYWIGHYEEAYRANNVLLAKKNLPENVKECIANNQKFVEPKIAVKQKPSILKKVG